MFITPLGLTWQSKSIEIFPGISFNPGLSHAADAFPTAAVMIREPERKKEQEKRRPSSRLSPVELKDDGWVSGRHLCFLYACVTDAGP